MSKSVSGTKGERSKNRMRAPILLALLVAASIPLWLRVFKGGQIRSVRAALLESNSKLALERLAELDGFNSTNAEVLYLLAIAHRRDHQFELADRCLQRAQLLGWPQSSIQFQRQLLMVQTGDLNSAPGLTSLLDSDDVSDLDALQIVEALARGYVAAHRISEAVQQLDRWIEWRPRDPTPHLLKAQLWAKSGEIAFAVEEYREILKTSPEHELARRQLAWALVTTNQVEDAAREYDVLRKSGADDPELRAAEAICFERVGRRDEAKKQLLEVLQTELPSEQRILVHIELAQIALDEKRYDDAIELMNEVIKLQPSSESIHYVLATAHSKLGRKDQAEVHLVKLRELNQQQQRIREITRALTEDTSNVELRFEAGQLSQARGLDQEATRWFHSALQIDPRHRNSHLALATLYRDAGDDEMAKFHQNFAEQLQTNSSNKKESE